MNDLLPPDDDDELAAAAAAAIREHDRVRAVLDEALKNVVSSMVAVMLGEADDVEQSFGRAMWEGLDRLDDDERITAIAMLLEPVAENRARALVKSFFQRLSRLPEVPHPLASKEGNSV